VKRSQNLMSAGSSAQQPNGVRKSPSLGVDKLAKNIQHASGKQSHSYGMANTAT